MKRSRYNLKVMSQMISSLNKMFQTLLPSQTQLIIPVVASLTRILEENWTSIEKYKSDHSHDEGKYRNICCGEVYRQQNGCDDSTKLLSFLFHIDGAPAVKDS